MLTRPANVDRAILVFIVAYEARNHVPSVLARIPRKLFDDPRVQFLCIDDASQDGTASAAAEWARSFSDSRIGAQLEKSALNDYPAHWLASQTAASEGFKAVNIDILFGSDDPWTGENPMTRQTCPQASVAEVPGAKHEVHDARVLQSLRAIFNSRAVRKPAQPGRKPPQPGAKP